jgi:nicotinamidase-related amidase
MQQRLLSFMLVAAGAAGLTLSLTSSRSPSQEAARTQAGPSHPPRWAPGGTRSRLTPDNCVVAFIDHQTGLTNLVHNAAPGHFKSMVVGLAKTAKLHALPTIITTSAEDGPNGPFMPEVLAVLPDAPVVVRNGPINAWDDPSFVSAVEKTGRKKIIMAGITTDVCVAFAALSALEAGYDVYVVVDASGSMNSDTQEAALLRMSEAGATIGTWFALACELLSDWRNPTGAGTAQLFVEHMPSYAEVFHSHAAAAPKPSAR